MMGYKDRLTWECFAQAALEGGATAEGAAMIADRLLALRNKRFPKEEPEPDDDGGL